MAIEELQNGRYKYLRRLGSGGMGEVYLMQDTRVNRQVAIKVLRIEEALYAADTKNTNSARLFEREARAIAALDHPNILPLYDFGEEALDEGGMTYMVMPYCADGSLEAWLRQRGSDLLPAARVAALIEQAAEALHYAHEQKVIHLDVKPSNFLIRGSRKDPLRPLLLLADFGISRNFTTVSSSSRTIRGTPAAMAPEQWSGEPVFASDQYALAVMTYEMLVGRPPFMGSMEQLMYRHFSVPPEPPSTFNPRLSSSVDAVLLRALSKKPEERYETIIDFASALVEAAGQPSAYSEAELAGYNTLAISPSEAEAGLSRMLTLTGGEEINVAIPPGAQDGQILRLPRPHAAPGQSQVVLVNIAIQSPTIIREDELANLTPEIQEAETFPSLRKSSSSEVGQKEPVRPVSETPVLARAAERKTPSGQVPLHLAADTPSGAQARPDGQTMMSLGRAGITTAPPPQIRPRRRPGLVALLSLIIVLLLVAGTFLFFLNRNSSLASGSATPTHAAQTVSVATSTPTPPPPGKDIAGSYNGSMADNKTGQSASLSVHIIQASQSGVLGGAVTFNQASSFALKGIVDLQGNFSFSVAQAAGQLPLVFHGIYTPDNNLHGYYCHSSSGSCQSDEGYFTVGPRF